MKYSDAITTFDVESVKLYNVENEKWTDNIKIDKRSPIDMIEATRLCTSYTIRKNSKGDTMGYEITFMCTPGYIEDRLVLDNSGKIRVVVRTYGRNIVSAIKCQVVF